MRKFLALGLIIFFFGSAEPVHASMHMMGENNADKTIEAQMSPPWRACKESKDCGLIQYGCTGMMAANKLHISETTKLAHKIGGNPVEIKCAPSVHMPNYVPTCMNSQCVATNPTE